VPTNNLQIKRYKINDCVLRFPQRGVDMPVARFQSVYRLNEIPMASVVPAIGRGLGQRSNLVTLRDIKERDEAEILLKVDGKEHCMLHGYVFHISAEDSGTEFSRRFSGHITIRHRMTKLAGVPASSFVFTGETGASLESLHFLKTFCNVFNPEPGALASIDPLLAFISEIQEQGDNAGLFPGEVLKYILKGLYKGFNEGQASADLLDEIVKTYGPANVTGFVGFRDSYLEALASSFSSLWKTSNSWQALLHTAQEFLLGIVPYNKGFYIANPYPLLRTPALEILPSEFVRFATGREEQLSEQVDAVVLTPPSMGEPGTDFMQNLFSFPPMSEAGGETQINKYYHYRKFPAWAQGLVDLFYTQLSAGEPYGERPNPEQNTDEYYQQIGVRLAQSYFGHMSLRQATASILFPFRTDIMPGTVLKIANPSGELGFIGDTLYGMVSSTKFVCDTIAESPNLSVEVELAMVRNEEDNQNDNLTLDGDPIFEGAWAGIDLDGGFVSDVPASTPMDSAPEETFDAAPSE
jgi:hypothetical protein